MLTKQIKLTNLSFAALTTNGQLICNVIPIQKKYENKADIFSTNFLSSFLGVRAQK